MKLFKRLLAGAPEPLDSSSPARAVADRFVQLAAGGQQSLRVSNQFSVFGGGDVDLRQNDTEHHYDQTSLSLNAGFTQLHATGLYRLTLLASELRIGGHRYRDTLAVGAEGQWTLSPTLSLLGQVQVAEMRHGESLLNGEAQSEAFRDGRSMSYALMLTQQFPDAPASPSFGARLSFTQDSNQRLRPDLNRDVPLLRVFGALSPSQRWRVSVGLTFYRQDFGGINLTSYPDSVRADRAWVLDATAQWMLDANWSWRLELSRQVNHSNQDLYDSQRTMAALKLRYQF